MLTISKPLGAAQVRQYHAEEFANARVHYYTADEHLHSEWHGRLAARWGLHGEVEEEAFQRLAEGQHPETGQALVRRQAARTYTNEHGVTVNALDHRAGWDATFSAPKSLSLTALIGHDERLLDAHRESVTVALNELERYVQARMGATEPAHTTGQWVAARFEHDSARPVNGYAAPQVHTHVVVFNVTEVEDGRTRALQPRELYRSQQYATAVYRSALAERIQALGYEVERGGFGQPEIRGYSHEYLEASSPRRQQIEHYLEQAQQHGSEAAEIAAHHTREPKLEASREAMAQHHRELAEAFGDQPAHVVEAAHRRTLAHEHAHKPTLTPEAAMTYAVDRNLEREAVVDERSLLRDALRRSMGELSIDAVKTAFERQIEQGELLAAEQRPGTPGRAFTTEEMRQLEHEAIQAMRHGQGGREALAVAGTVLHQVEHDHPHLTARQREAVEQIAASHDQVFALEGIAGAGKTTTLAAVREMAERQGYAVEGLAPTSREVEGLAPTSRAAQQLAQSGIESGTLQRHLARGHEVQEGRRHLYVLDESSLTSTRQMHAFLSRLQAEDRVLLVGDTRQHQAVEAGRPYQQLQEAGLAVARLDDIIRQRDPALKAVVEQLSRGEVREAFQQLTVQGRVHEVANHEARLQAIARDYLQDPGRTLVVSPDHRSRVELNLAIHEARRNAGQIERQEHEARVLVPRQDVTGADRQWAAQYQQGDVLRYSAGSQALGLPAGSYARVEEVHPHTNRLTVVRDSGEAITYDPRRLQGVSLYREAERTFSVGDRVQVTAPDTERRIANRELGTIERIDDSRQIHLRSTRADAWPTLPAGRGRCNVC